jgi:TrwC relaxase
MARGLNTTPDRGRPLGSRHMRCWRQRRRGGSGPASAGRRAIYRASCQPELARTLGVEWTAADAHGNRELVGMPDDLARLFSKRTDQIDLEVERLEADGQERTPRLVKWGVHATRKPQGTRGSGHPGPGRLPGRRRRRRGAGRRRPAAGRHRRRRRLPRPPPPGRRQRADREPARQHQAWEREALEVVRGGLLEEAVAAYRAHDRVVAADSKPAATLALLNDWWQACGGRPGRTPNATRPRT